MKKIIEYLPLLTVCGLYFGFCNLHYYYSDFKINIYSFVTSAEILFSVLPSIVLLASSILILLVQTLVNKRKDEIEIDSIKNTSVPRFPKLVNSVPIIFFSVLIIQNFVLPFFLIMFNVKEYKLQEINYLIVFFMLIIIFNYFSHAQNQPFLQGYILW
jgi:hypothetical protein